MTAPSYHSIKNDEIEEIKLENGKLRLLAGQYKDNKGYEGKYLPLDYYDIHLDPNASISIDTEPNRSVMIFTLSGEVSVGGELVREKTAAKLTSGDTVEIKSAEKNAQVLFISSTSLGEPIAWGGPIVMNTKAELQKAFTDLNQGTFLQKRMSYDD